MTTTPTYARRGLSIAETANVLGVHPDTVRTMIATGGLRARQVNGKGSRVVVFADSVEAFFDAAAAEIAVPDVERNSEIEAALLAEAVLAQKRAIAKALAEGSITPAEARDLFRSLAEVEAATS